MKSITKQYIVDCLAKNELTDKYVLNPEVIFKSTDSKIIALVFDEDEFIYEIDGIAREIWMAITNNEAISDCILRICTEKKWPAEILVKDTVDFVQKLKEKKLIAES